MREINNLVLIGVPLLSNTRKDRGINKLSIFKFLNKVGLVSTETIESIKNKSGSIDYRNSEGVMRDTLVKAVNDNLEDKLLEIKSNVKLIWGENDTEVPVSIAKKSRELITNSELTIIPNDGHNMLRSNSNSIIEVLKTL
jgi:pimeloyl-ACP methyl ester carboxylesterase